MCEQTLIRIHLKWAKVELFTFLNTYIGDIKPVPDTCLKGPSFS